MKISVIMQSYLGDYPGSRSKPEEKFIRAVSSFISQTHNDKELIIVSDGCEITKKLYDTFYKNYEEIKFIFLDKKTNKDTNSIKIEEDKKIFTFRGIPRALGCTAATGDIICYFDTDDIILPNHLSILNTAWTSVSDDIKWINSPIRYVHSRTLSWSKEPEERKKQIQEKISNNKSVDLKYYGIKDIFFEEELDQNSLRCSSSSISHRKDIKTTWTDSTMILSKDKKEGLNEDHLFFNNMTKRDNYKGTVIRKATLVVCHMRDSYEV